MRVEKKKEENEMGKTRKWNGKEKRPVERVDR